MAIFTTIGLALGATAASAAVVGGLAAVSATTSVAQLAQQRKAGKAAKAGAAAERRRVEIENTHKVRQQIRSARHQQASMTNQAAQSGALGSSGLAGGSASIGSQLAGNLSFMSDIATENTAISNAAVRGANAQGKAALFGQVGQMAGTIFGSFNPSGLSAATLDTTAGAQVGRGLRPTAGGL